MTQILTMILSLFIIPGISFAEVYKWIDDKEVVYFTDNITQVPEKYLPKTEKIGFPVENEEVKVEGDLTAKKKGEPHKDRLGRGEAYWRGRMDEWKDKLRELQESLEGLRVKYNELTEKFNHSKNTVERGSIRKEREQIREEMNQDKNQIGEVEDRIKKRIPEEADFYKANPEWIK